MAAATAMPGAGVLRRGTTATWVERRERSGGCQRAAAKKLSTINLQVVLHKNQVVVSLKIARDACQIGSGAQRSRRFGAIALVALTLAAAGCGGADAPARSVRLDAARDGSLRFERTAARTTSGRVAIEMANPSEVPHAIGIRGKGVDETGETVGNGGTSRVEADLEPGTYELFCPVGGHEEAGMTATLVVED